MRKKIVILGGGVIGMFSAYYLAKAGSSVTILDKNKVGSSSSGNAGMIVPSHVIPLAAPGMISKGIRWMFDSKSPFYVKPRVNSELISWGWNFYRSANQKHVDESKHVLRDISLLSKKLYQEIATISNDFEYDERGLLMLYQSKKVEHEERTAASLASKLGLEVELFDADGLSQLNYGVKTNALGAVLYKSDAHLQANRLIVFLRSELSKLGVSFIDEADCRSIETNGGKIRKIVTQNQSFEADEFVIAAGAWSAELARLVNEEIKLLPGKGYSFTLSKMEKSPVIPTILCEGKVAVTPFKNTLRFGGTMEISHLRDRQINLNRVKGIVDTINNFYPEIEVKMPEIEDIWMGYRPCSPTGLPYIGRSKKYANLTYATGHGMMGVSLAPATGFLVKQIIMSIDDALTPKFQLSH